MSSDNKYVTPKLPTAQNIMEDLLNESIVKSNNQVKFVPGETTLTDAYTLYSHIQELKSDIEKQNDLKEKLEELNKELASNIENMRKQQ